MIEDEVGSLDVSPSHVERQTSEGDRMSLLALQDAVVRHGKFSYLEIGSHLGGTLQAMLADPRCRRVISIDLRPCWQPDEPPQVDGYYYPGNSTKRMIEHLSLVPHVDLSKLTTIVSTTGDINPGDLDPQELCSIDGETLTFAADSHGSRRGRHNQSSASICDPNTS
jgi:hypothetical protein